MDSSRTLSRTPRVRVRLREDYLTNYKGVYPEGFQFARVQFNTKAEDQALPVACVSEVLNPSKQPFRFQSSMPCLGNICVKAVVKRSNHLPS